MSEEQRNRQSLNLITGTRPIHSDSQNGHKRYNAKDAGYWNRWIRISLKAQGRKTILSNIHTHINVDSLCYGLKLNMDKSRDLTFSKSNHQHFHFLGFTFYWGIQGSKRM